MSRMAPIAGVAIALAGLGFVTRRLVADWDQTRELLEGAEWPWLVLAVPVALAGMTLVGLPWVRSLGVLGHHASVAGVLSWYFPGQLGKYVPGAIWPVVGRAELAARGGAPRAVAYGSVALTLSLTYLAAVVAVMVLLPFSVAGGGVEARTYLLLVLLPAGLLMLHPAVLQRVVALAERLLSRDVAVRVPPWKDTVGLLFLHLPAWFVIGSATYLVTRAFVAEPDVSQIMLATVISWIVGFVVVPVPGGIGVREAAFAAAATSLAPDVGATVAITARLCFIVADLVGAGLVVVLGAARTRLVSGTA